MKQKELSKSQVALQNVSPQKRKFSDETEYKMNHYSKVLVKKNLSFPWKNLRGEIGENCQNLKQVSEEATVQVGDTLSVKAKVLSKSEEQIVYSYRMQKDLKKCELIIADSSGAMPLTLWEDAIDKVDIDESYLFGDVKLCFFKRKYLNGTTNSKIEICAEAIELSPDSDLAVEHLAPQKKEYDEIKGRNLGIDVNKQYVCMNCNTRMGQDEEDDDKIVQCSSCNVSMLKQTLLHNVTAYMIIADETGENLGRYFCSGETLNSMFTSIASIDEYHIEETNAKNLSKKMIVQTLLLIPKVSFKISREDKIIHSMQVEK